MWISWDEAIHLVGRNPALMMVFESQFSVAAAAGQNSVEVKLDLASSLPHLIHRGKSYGVQLRRQPMPVYCERQIVKYPRSVRALFGL
jgi:hypothetical protein